MATYLIVNLLFVAAVAALLRVKPSLPSTRTLHVLFVIVLLTAVFDSLLVSLHMIGYSPDLISGIYIGTAPIEDFFYALLAVLLVPALWNRLGNDNHEHN